MFCYADIDFPADLEQSFNTGALNSTFSSSTTTTMIAHTPGNLHPSDTSSSFSLHNYNQLSQCVHTQLYSVCMSVVTRSYIVSVSHIILSVTSKYCACKLYIHIILHLIISRCTHTLSLDYVSHQQCKRLLTTGPPT